MKNIYIILSILLGVLLFSNNTQAQIVDVCAGTDSITLRAGNYQYGTVQWQSSIDNLNWTNIHGANDTIYKYFPSEEKYFRAMIRFAECPPIYSEVSHVQLKPLANAGADRIVPGNSVIMMGSINSASSGSWSVYSGNGGSFTDSSDPYTEFEGTDTIYQVVWEVSNACGTSSDTIEIQFRENIYIDELVVVDETDILTSDAVQLEAGEYVIEFSDPVPEITDSTVLLGLINEGFMRKVESFTNVGDVYTMQTVQASLEDITKYGAFDVGQAFSLDTSLNGSKKSSYIRLNHMPTRAELMSNPDLKNGNYYYVVESEPIYTHPGVGLKNNLSKGDSTLIELEFNNCDPILSTDNVDVHLNGSYSFRPNFKADLDVSWLRIKSFKMGMYNGIIERDYEIVISASASENVLNEPFTLFTYQHNIVFIVGGVPVWILAEFNIDGKISVDISAEMDIAHSCTKTSQITYALEYESGEWESIDEKQEYVETDNSFEVSGDLTQHFDIGPNIKFKIYGTIGPYIDARITEDLNLCFNNDNWQVNMDIGGEITVGVLGEALGLELFDKSQTWQQGFYNLQFPHNIEIVSGNNQTYSEGQELEQEVTVKVIGNHGIIVPGAIVHFDPQNGGTVNNSNVFTNSEGFSSVTWTPGGLEESQLDVSVYDCDGNNINNSPVIISAYTESNDCSQTSLSVAISQEDGIIQPIPSMGTPPYTYSTDGISFNSTVPQISIVAGETYLFMVRDDAGCYAAESFAAPIDACENTDIIISANVMGNVIEVDVVGGSNPYQYSIDDQVGYSSNNTFTVVVTGTHIIYVKDANECEASIEVEVYDEVVPVIAEFTVDNSLTYINQSVQFYDFSNNATSWLWDFGDGATSTDRNPLHVFTVSGTYDISLTVENEYGTDTEVKLDYLWVADNAGGTVTDIDGNTYQTVIIGEQEWMAENLRVTHYPDGTPIPYIEDNTVWGNLDDNDTDDAYCYYNNNTNNEADIYGALYTWAAVMNGSISSNTNPSGVQGVCPEGWHVPSYQEWSELEVFLIDNGYTSLNGGYALKSVFGWENEGNGINEFGFSALPSGYRHRSTGGFEDLGYSFLAHTCEESDPTRMKNEELSSYSSEFNSGYGETLKSNGISVRCVKNPDYYGNISSTDFQLKTDLHNLIKDHTAIEYTDVFVKFNETDIDGEGYIYDIYSDNPSGADPYNYVYQTDQCGNYGAEGDCYNREHSFPKSWFADEMPMYTDLMHMLPTDGYVNGRRSNNPYAETDNPLWTSLNGSELGTCSYPGYSGTIFEPIDAYKGDIARIYFYMATRYEDVISGWTSDILNGTSDQVFEDWYLNMLKEWHQNDPVSQKEIDRNNAIFQIQNNRNPFVDHPEYVNLIWGN